MMDWTVLQCISNGHVWRWECPLPSNVKRPLSPLLASHRYSVDIRQTRSFELSLVSNWEKIIFYRYFAHGTPFPPQCFFRHRRYMYKKVNQIQKLEIAANAIDHDSPILLLHKFDKDYTHKNKEKQNKGRKKIYRQ